MAYETITPETRMAFWYRRGDLTSEPMVATVTRMNSFGVCALSAWGPNQTIPFTPDGVHHCADPYVESHKEDVAEPDHGTWEYLPIEKEAMYKANAKLRAERKEEEKAALKASQKPVEPVKLMEDVDVDNLTVDQIIVQGRNKGHNGTIIARVLTEKTGEDWNHQKVTMRQRQLARTNPGA